MELNQNTEKLDNYRKRAAELVGKMTLEEKVAQTLYQAPAVERLNIKAYNWWNEALHGVARAGTATVFPQAIGLAATFDEDLLEQVGDAVSTEWTFYYSSELHYDYECIWKIFSIISLYSNCTDSVIFLCRRAEPEYRKKFFEILCSSVSGGSNRGTCLHYIFIVCIITASSRSRCSSSDYGVELYWRIDFQYAWYWSVR